MKSVDFPQRNTIIGKNQPQYLPLYAYVKDSPATPDPEGSMLTRYEFTDEEIEEIVKTRGIWHNQLTFRGKYQPVRLMVESPFHKHADAWCQFFYKLVGDEIGIWVWNAADLPAPQMLRVDNLYYKLDKSKPYGYYTALETPVGSYYIAELPDTELALIAEYGKSLLQRFTGPGLTAKYKIPNL